MEKKMKHRILGGIVIIGLGVILMPLLQTKSDLATQVTVVKAPPFPDQSVQISAVDANPVPLASEQSFSQNKEASQHSENIMEIARPSVVNEQTNKNMTAPQNATTVSKEAESQGDTPSSTSSQYPLLHENDELEVDQSIYSADEEERTPQVRLTKNEIPKMPPQSGKLKKIVNKKLNSKYQQKTMVHVANKETSHFAKTALNDNGLFDLSKAAWVIQLGSFKNKANALRLVNELRANGYPAFIQKISTTFGDHTQVFVGPENKRLAAHALATRLENEMHMKGIVISYQPLTL